MCAARRNNELDSCIPVSRRTINCSVMNLRKSPVLGTPLTKGGHPPSRKLRDVSGFLHPHDEIVWLSQAVCIFWTLRSRKLRDVSGSLHPQDEFADSLALWGLFGHSTHENSGKPQAFCTPHYENCRHLQALSIFGRDVSGFLHPHDDCNWL